MYFAVFAVPQGTQIQATFWREAAEKYLDVLQEGKVRLPQQQSY
jgi:hypothetical protein